MVSSRPLKNGADTFEWSSATLALSNKKRQVPISPPKSVGVTLKLNIGIFFTQVDKVRAKYQRQKAYVQGGYQFLQIKKQKSEF